MKPPPSASPISRVLGASLRVEREARRKSVRELANMLEITPAMVSQWELATRLPAPEQVARILGTLGVTGKRYDQIMFLARHVRDPNWLDASPPDIPAPLTGVIECERTAFRITNWALLIIPGLLQTPDYARAQLTDSGINVEEADIRLVVRLERQKVLTTENPVQLTALISEIRRRRRGRSTCVKRRNWGRA